MTSGVFHSFDTTRIWVDRESRQRKEIGDISDLVNSLSTVGQINPILIKRDGELIAGERRWSAAKQLGWTHIMVQFTDELPEDELYLIELEENVKRLQLTWQEEVDAIHRYTELRRKREPNITFARIAEELGKHPSGISQAIGLTGAIKENPRIAELDNYGSALNVMKRQKKREEESVIAQLGQPLSVASSATPEAPILTRDFTIWAAEYSGAPFNFLHLDFPYGVNMHKTGQSTAATVLGTYADNEDVYWKLLSTLADHGERIWAESAHMMFWFSMDYYHETQNALTAMGWRVNPFPLIWHKSDNAGIIPDANRQPRRVYETAFMCARGDRFIVGPVANLFAAPGRNKSIHMNEKNPAMLRHFLRMFVDKHTAILDPTCGSGMALRVARELGAGRILGLEINPQFSEAARLVFFEDTDMAPSAPEIAI